MTQAELFYQAIGELYASFVVTSSGTKLLDMGKRQYRAIVPEKLKNKYQKIQGGQAYWRVYPQFQDGHLAFEIVSVSEQPKSEPGRFVIQGDWVNLAQIQIWRNAEILGKSMPKTGDHDCCRLVGKMHRQLMELSGNFKPN